jgi:hypothetical protein
MQKESEQLSAALQRILVQNAYGLRPLRCFAIDPQVGFKP